MPPTIGGGEICAKCNKKVYFAERAVALSKTFHKDCLKCTTCGKRLNTGNICDNEDCHRKNFGPKGYGYGQGSGALPYTQ